MSNLKKNIKLIILIITIILISGGVGVFATYNYFASDIKYTENKTVEQALDDLYDKSKNYILPSGTENITSNGSYNIANKESVNVNVTVAGTKTLLWTNSSPSSNMTEGNIVLSNSIANYSHILIQWYFSTTDKTIFENLYKVQPLRDSTNAFYGMTIRSGSYCYNRVLWYVDNTHLQYNQAWKLTYEGYATNFLIPYKIYGLNFSY